MTREEAIKSIQDLTGWFKKDKPIYKALEMAISAMLENEELSKDLDEALKEIDEYEQGLEQQPCEDAVYLTKEAYSQLCLEASKWNELQICEDSVSIDVIIEWLKSKDIIKMSNQEKNARKELQALFSVQPKQKTGRCRTCKYGEIYNDSWCKCRHPLIDGLRVEISDKCEAEEVIELNRRYKAEKKGEA